MRAEARSVSHFKEVSYKLENRVVELAQTLAQQKEEKARLKDKAADLEAQVRSWIAKYDQLDEKAKSLEDLVGKCSDQTSFQQKRDNLRGDYMQTFNKIKLQDKEIAHLTEELTRQKQEISAIHQSSSNQAAAADKPLEETDMAELKEQIAALKSQLSQTLSKTRRSTKDINGSTKNRRYRRGGSSSSSRLYGNQGIIDVNKPAVASDHPLYELLWDNNLLQEDILKGLILSQTPTTEAPSTASSSRKDIVYPAHLIGLCVTQLVKKGCIAEAQRWFFISTETIEKHCLVTSDDMSVYIFLEIANRMAWH